MSSASSTAISGNINYEGEGTAKTWNYAIVAVVLIVVAVVAVVFVKK